MTDEKDLEGVVLVRPYDLTQSAVTITVPNKIMAKVREEAAAIGVPFERLWMVVMFEAVGRMIGGDFREQKDEIETLFDEYFRPPRIQ